MLSPSDRASLRQVDDPLPQTRTLFTDDTGSPMRFFLRPGTLKRRFASMIEQGGGVVCRVQEPGAISLVDPKEAEESGNLESVSTQFILDCIERNERLNSESYKFSKRRKRSLSGRLGDSSRDSPSTSAEHSFDNRKSSLSGRVSYSKEEDVAILEYLKKHDARDYLVKGNKIWQRMEKEAVTSHTWQSMKDHYRKYLARQKSSDKNEYIAASNKQALIFSTPKRREPSKQSFLCPSAVVPVQKQPLCAPGVTAHDMQSKEALKKSKEDTNCKELLKTGGQSLESRENETTKKKSGILLNSVSELEISNLPSDDETPELEVSNECPGISNGPANQIHRNSIQNEVCETRNNEISKGSKSEGAKNPTTGLSEFVMNDDSHVHVSQTQEDMLPGSYSPSQAEIDSAVKAVQLLQEEFSQDLTNIMQALLKNSGDVAAAKHYLRTGCRPDHRPLWTRQDDLSLLSGDPSQVKRLSEKYGDENVAKRVTFLKT